MDLLSLFIYFLILIVIVVLVFLIYSGIFDSVSVRMGRPRVRNFTFAYKFLRGPYKNTSVVFSEVCKLAPDLNSCGIFYDEPGKVKEEDLRCAVGAILAEGSEEASDQLVSLMKTRGYQVVDLPACSAVVESRFSYRTRLSLFISMFKVYPAMAKYIKNNIQAENAHPCVELYFSDEIYYMNPLDHQEDFYVREFNKSN